MNKSHHTIGCKREGCLSPRIANRRFCRPHYQEQKKKNRTVISVMREKFYMAYYKRMPWNIERRKVLFDPKKAREANRRCQKTARGIIRSKAGWAVKSALRRGDITRQPCKRCGNPRSQAHHCSYLPEHWLSIEWLCTFHHGEWHRENKPVYPPDNATIPGGVYGKGGWRGEKSCCSSKFRGVCRNKGGTWRAGINVRGKYNFLGDYATEKEAAIAFNNAIPRLGLKNNTPNEV